MKNVGVVVGHDEVLVPTTPGYATFFGAVEREGARVVVLDDATIHAGLAGCDALVLGGPHKPIPLSTIESIRSWIDAGGRLLLTAGAGGDRPIDGSTNVSEVVPGLSFGNDVVHFYSVMEMYENLVVAADAGLLAARLRGKEVSFVASCTLGLDEALVPLATLAPASSSQSNHEGMLVFQSPIFEGDDRLTADGGQATALEAPTYAELSMGRGLVIAMGSTSGLHDSFVTVSREQIEMPQRAFLDHLLLRLLQRGFDEELERRLREPQRHRLLQGYPMPKLMLPEDPPTSPDRWPRPLRPPRSPGGDWPQALPRPGQHRSCIVGVLPHPYCNPTVRGCGFCTFPQEKLARDDLPTIVRAVQASIAGYRQNVLWGNREATPALYFGGGTANLTPPALFQALCEEIAKTFDTTASEITLEGVPRYFGIGGHALLHTMREVFPKAVPRISMGIQTFDRAQIERMGRGGFGDRDEIEELVHHAHELGFSVSCDLLINLPGQSLAQMLDDLAIADGMGFDQICVYHLVLFEGLGTPWSENRSLLAALNDNAGAFANQRLCRKRLYELGFTQTTLTNFERRASPRPRFQYEPLGFQPDRHDLLGFGPGAISLAADRDFHRAWKTVRAQETAGYMRGAQRGFIFGEDDMRLLFLTRSIAGLGIDTRRYEALFGNEIHDDFGGEIDAMVSRGLLRDRPGSLALSPEGMFYADSVAGLLAWRRVQIIRDRLVEAPTRLTQQAAPHLRFHDPNVATYGGMG